MEELQSTDVLDREIFEDARKKALRILKTCEETIKTQDLELEKKITKTCEELDKKYEEIKINEEKKLMFRLPIDKHRVKIKKIEELLNTAIENWYKNLSPADIQKLLEKEFEKLKSTVDSSLLTDNSSLLTDNSSLLTDNSSLITDNSSLLTDNCPLLTEIILDTPSVRLTASIKNIIESLLQDKRAELVEVLIGTSFLESDK